VIFLAHHRQIRKYAKEQVGTGFLRWCLLHTCELHRVFVATQTAGAQIGGSYYVTLLKSYIRAKKGRFIHVRSQISWYVCSMYLGTKGDFFSYTCTFCALLPRCCALLCGRPLSYVCTVHTISNTPNFTNCVRMYFYHLPSHYFPARKQKKKFWFHVR
jgi:hypothetical protein